MKKKKYIFIPIIALVLGFILVRAFGVSYSATNMNYNYFYIRRNMLSHHFISGNSNPSGTILIKTDAKTSVSGTRAIVYCAHQGKNISGSGYAKVDISDTTVSAIRDKKDKLNAVLKNSYPYVTITELKEILKNALGNDLYTELKIDTLDAQEAMTATQAALWNVIENKTSYKYSSTKKIGNIRYSNFHKGTSNSIWSINWDSVSSYNINEGCYKGIGTNLDCGSKSTYLREDDTAESVGTYKTSATEANKLKERINKIIEWYLTLSDTTTTDQVPSFEIKDYDWSDAGETLIVTIQSTNPSYVYDFNYNVEFTDLLGNELTYESATPVFLDGVVTGYTYVLKNIQTKGVNASVHATQTGVPSNAYVYESKGGWSASQYLIGIESGDINVTNVLNILNDGTGKITVYKTGKNNSNGKTEVTYGELETPICGTDNNPCQEGAYVILYASDKKTIIREFITEKDEMVLTGIPLGTYYIQETVAPIGHELNNKMQEIVINEEGAVVNVQIHNDPTKLCIKKVSSEDNSIILDGSTFRLEDAFGGTYDEFHPNSVSENGYCIAEGQLDSGYYYLVETEAPKNFVKPNAKFKVKVGTIDPDDIVEEPIDDVPIIELEVVNNTVIVENDPGVVISKSDLSTGACVEGAKLVVKDKEGKVVDEWTSSCVQGNDNYQLSLDPGTYTLTETIAPSGYATAETITFTIDANGKVDKSLDMKDAPIDACFLKVSKDSEEGLPGAEFEIYQSDGTLYDTFTTNYLATCFEYMPVGTYTLKETKAPKGYKLLEEEITITIKDTSERQVFEIENEIDVPKTSMDYSRIIIIFASVFMVFGLGLVGYYVYKKRV